ncbi:hypothetical protein [Nocardia seriolae]|nr:hypothetical protein [Nocardia seriolae]OJF78598.1 hypothetical protein NS14008_04360 [Nocardia seriolae]QUN18765.1 hypothetical protein KEC46_04985 [Nocardia seriolae]WKY51468.1 hypothetical protein Q5P07_31780 [Nocardia seriolae]BAW04561.1 conserved hypothetical protein [Nocardia seriolae]BEK90849.1 hypothetical protein NSERKGN1266_68000 [Nocardia seriolae]
MYNVGFGDAFTVTVRHADQTWRMLVDCGVHSQGRVRPIRESVQAIIADLTAAAADHHPHLDVIVATHHHADHISGFACDEWAGVAVDEVWVPFVEDPDDADARRIRGGQADAADGLAALIGKLGNGLSASVEQALDFAVNSQGNAAATDRLLGRNKKGFASAHRVRYLPGKDKADNTIEVERVGLVAHILGPPRDERFLARMNPPAKQTWPVVRAVASPESAETCDKPANLFNPRYFAQDGLPLELTQAKDQLKLEELLDHEDRLLRAAAILENAVNNTSVFFVLDISGTRLLFPGDAQQGAWDHVLADAHNAALLSDLAFYKVGHHGSHNATPREFVETDWKTKGYAMVPFGLVERWARTIPKQSLLNALRNHHHTVIRADEPPRAVPGSVAVHGDLWTEVTLTA